MVFENVTALELHFHTGEESEVEEDERPVRTVVRPEQKSGRKPIAIAAVMVVVSITLSIVVTLLARRLMRGDDS